jgi:hypothetical protein
MDSFTELIKQPWFALSPSPFSFAFYLIGGILGAWRLLRIGVEYKRFPRIMAFVDSLILLVLVVIVQDSIWLVFNTFRWILPYYSDVATFWNYYVRFIQNGIMAGLMLLFSWDRFRAGIFRVSRLTWLCFGIITAWLFLQFVLAPNQAYTDWMFAVSYGFPDWLILQGFILNILMKLLLGITFLSIFQKKQVEDSTIRL